MKKTILALMGLFVGLVSFADDNSLNTAVMPETAPAEATMAPEEEEYIYVRHFSSITEIGSVIAYGKPYFNIYQAVGVRVNPYFFIGQGVGLQVSNNHLYQVQTTADIRTYVLDRKVTPMFTVQVGVNKVGNAPENEKKKLNDTQLTMNAGAGILVKARENASFTINGGYTIFSDFKNSVQGGFVKVGYVF